MNWKRFIDGLNIMSRYIKDDEFPIGAQHDQIWVYIEFSQVSEEDRIKLIELKWFWDEDSWSCHP